MTPALQAFIDELHTLQERVDILETEKAVLTGMLQQKTTGQVGVITIFGRPISQLAKDLDRLRRFDNAAKEST